MLSRTSLFRTLASRLGRPTLSLEHRLDALEKSYGRVIQTQQAQTARGAVQAAAAVSRVDEDGEPIPAEVFAELYEFSARQPVKRQTIQRLSVIDNPSDLRQQSIFWAREVTIRLAHGAAELAHAPFGFAQMEAIKRLRHFHELSYVDITRVNKLDFSETENIVRLCQTLQRIYQRHHITCELISTGIRQFVHRNQLDANLTDLQSSLDDYADFQRYLANVLSDRVKIRFQIGHFIECARMVLPEVELAAQAWNEQTQWSDQHVAPRFVGLDPSTFVGSISRATNMVTVAQLAIENAKQVMSAGGEVRAPAVELKVHGDPDFTFTFPPRQAFNVITALVAHGMRQEMHRAAQEMRIHNNKMKPVEVLVSQFSTNKDAVVRIRDHGGGVPLHEVESLQTCLYSVRTSQTVTPYEQAELKGWMKSALRLPYATMLAQVFGGDLTVASVEGDGNTVCFCAPTSGVQNLLI